MYQLYHSGVAENLFKTLIKTNQKICYISNYATTQHNLRPEPKQLPCF